MSTITFYDMLGVASAPSPRDAAANIWPSHSVQGTTGRLEQPDITQTRLLMEFLQGVLTFRNMRPGADNERVGFTADVVVNSTPLQLPLVLATMPDVEFRLLPTPTTAARVTVTAGNLGTELIVDALPVEIRLPQGFLGPLEPPEPIGSTGSRPAS